MKFLDKLRPHTQDKNHGSKSRTSTRSRENSPPSNHSNTTSTRRTPRAANLDPAILKRIFAHVCPHTEDESYETLEEASPDHGCPLCDLRDLAHCVQVNGHWARAARPVLYHSVRIDAVHYCPREGLLADRRKRRSFFERNGDTEDTAKVRLGLFARTLRESDLGLGRLVLYFKTPYMTRRTAFADLARAVARMPNLRYIDVPDEVLSGSAEFTALRHELQARCTALGKMIFRAGAERAFEALVTRGVWKALEVVHLEGIAMDPMKMRHVLGSLHNLRALKIQGMPDLDDTLFHEVPRILPFPPLSELLFDQTTGITADGILVYLTRPEVQAKLRTLSLTETGVLPSTLHAILGTAPTLDSLSIIETVSTPFSTLSSPSLKGHTATLPLLTSSSLRTLRFEITAPNKASNATYILSTYHAYLTHSLMAGGLPNLQSLYVRDVDFPLSLTVLSPPIPQFAIEAAVSDTDKSYPPSSTNPFARSAIGARDNANATILPQRLVIYTKGTHDLTWDFQRIDSSLPLPRSCRPSTSSTLAVPGTDTSSNSGGAGASRPLSHYGLDGGGAAARYGAKDARRSVLVSMGRGAWVEVPEETTGTRATSAGAGGAAGEERGLRRRVSGLVRDRG